MLIVTIVVVVVVVLRFNLCDAQDRWLVFQSDVPKMTIFVAVEHTDKKFLDLN